MEVNNNTQICCWAEQRSLQTEEGFLKEAAQGLEPRGWEGLEAIWQDGVE